MTKMVWSQGGHTKRRLLQLDLYGDLESKQPYNSSSYSIALKAGVSFKPFAQHTTQHLQGFSFLMVGGISI